MADTNEFPITIERHEGVYVLRDDLLPGGTKSILLDSILDPQKKYYVYASPVYGGFQIALAKYVKALNDSIAQSKYRTTAKKAVIFTAARKDYHDNTIEVIRNEGEVIHVPNGYLSVTQARAREFCDRNKLAQYIEFGAKTNKAKEVLIDRVKQVISHFKAINGNGNEPDEIWCAIGSGLLFESIVAATSKTCVCGVIVGKDYKANQDVINTHYYGSIRPRTALFRYDRSFDKPARIKPPFPSMSNYDAKTWEICQQTATGKNILFWNVL